MSRGLHASRAQRRLLVLLGCLCLCVGASALDATWPTPAEAQDSQARPSKQQRKARKRKQQQARAGARKRAAAPKPRATDPKKQDEKRAPARPVQGAEDGAESAGASADSEIVREGEREVKVMNFSGLDVEGRLKSPQLLYFVHRVRAEFDRPRLPHRSFIPELARSTHGEELR